MSRATQLYSQHHLPSMWKLPAIWPVIVQIDPKEPTGANDDRSGPARPARQIGDAVDREYESLMQELSGGAGPQHRIEAGPGGQESGYGGGDSGAAPWRSGGSAAPWARKKDDGENAASSNGASADGYAGYGTQSGYGAQAAYPWGTADGANWSMVIRPASSTSSVCCLYPVLPASCWSIWHSWLVRCYWRSRCSGCPWRRSSSTSRRCPPSPGK